jgi:hypothetical protein
MAWLFGLFADFLQYAQRESKTNESSRGSGKDLKPGAIKTAPGSRDKLDLDKRKAFLIMGSKLQRA